MAGNQAQKLMIIQHRLFFSVIGGLNDLDLAIKREAVMIVSNITYTKTGDSMALKVIEIGVFE